MRRTAFLLSFLLPVFASAQPVQSHEPAGMMPGHHPPGMVPGQAPSGMTAKEPAVNMEVSKGTQDLQPS